MNFIKFIFKIDDVEDKFLHFFRNFTSIQTVIKAASRIWGPGNRAENLLIHRFIILAHTFTDLLLLES